MTYELTRLADLNALPFDQIIDVRSPAEFALDHLPGAINLPVLTNNERATVGTIYVQENRFRARKIGAALVARNAAFHLENALADKDGSYQPLVYCWRGGQRSGSFASILEKVGWRVQLLSGGYRSYRRLVANALYDTEFSPPVVILAGNTGTAKTDLLWRLRDRGTQIIDLEGLAGHRGSLFGTMPGGQPTQKTFEGALAAEIAALDPTRPVVIEAESSKVGNINLPPQLWKAMCAAPRITIQAPLQERARYLTRVYTEIVADQGKLLETISKLSRLHSADRIEQWRDYAQKGAFEQLATGLMQHHYDPRYSKQSTEQGNDIVTLVALTPDALNLAAETLATMVEP
ncbi:MAG: tRNA 2-selenouridine synthase [Paracoccaceae bacterium]|jgi:tRNA 2-selenouridine synthase